MAVRITKSAVNIREKLAELERPIGVNGAALMKTETPQEAFSLIGARNRNRIINGSMNIFQRETATTIGANSTYALDRWLFGRESATESARFTVTQQALTTSDAPFADGIRTTMKIDITTASGGISAAQSHYLMQRIEGYNISDLAYGTSSAKPCTLSFWLKTDVKVGTMAVSLYNTGNRHYVQSISATTSWTKYSLTFPGDASGSLPNDNTSALQVMFVLSAGSNLQSTANAWTAGFKNSLSGQADFTDSTSNNIYITGVQLEPGTVATPFERRSYGQELALCQRYHYSTSVTSGGYLTLVGGSTTKANGTIFFPVTMRIAPSMTGGNLNRITNFGVLDYSGTYTFSASQTYPEGAAIMYTQSSGSTWALGTPLAINPNASLTTITASAEL